MLVLTESQQYDLFFELAKNLSHPSREIRQSTIFAISRIANRRCSNLLMDKLELEEDVFLKASLLRVLGDISTPNLLEPMDQYLAHFEPRVRSNAIESLARLKVADQSKLVQRIQPLLKDENNRVVATALRELLRMGYSENLPLLNLMLKGTDPLRRSSAIWVVGELKLQEFLDDVIFAMYSENYQVHAIAKKVLRRFDQVLVHNSLFANLSMDDPLVRVYTCRYLEEFCGELTDSWKTILLHLVDVERPYVAAFALRILYRFALPEGYEILKSHLFSKDNHLRSAAVEGLKYFSKFEETKALLNRAVELEQNPRLLATLIYLFEAFPSDDSTNRLKALLQHEDSRVCANAIEVLGKLGDTQLINILRPFVENSNHRIMANAAVAVFRMGEKKVVKRLEEALSTGSTGLRASAAYALGEIGSREVVELLIEKLLDDQQQVRAQIINGLLKQEKVILKRLVETLKATPRLEARKALAELVQRVSVEKNEEGQISDLIELYSERVHAFEIPESLEPEEVNKLEELLFCEDQRVRIYATYVLGEKKVLGSIPKLVCLLFERDEEVQAESIMALKKIGDPTVLVFLMDIFPRLSGDNIRLCMKTMATMTEEKISADYFQGYLSDQHLAVLESGLESN